MAAPTTETPPEQRRWLTLGVFPVIFGGAITAGLLGFEHGVGTETALGGMLVVGVINFVAAITIIALERVHPHVPEWNSDHGDTRTDVLHLIVTMIALPEVFRALAFASLYGLSVSLSASFGGGLWPTGLPLFAQMLIAIVLTELIYYWLHRGQHTIDLLWRLHAVHHSAPRLYWLNAARFHPLDTLSGYIVQAPLLIVLGAPEAVIGMFLVFTGVHGMMQHANIRMRLGPLNQVFSMAELHRWHHSRTLAEANTNFGGNIILWDQIFGTRYLPKDRVAPIDIGIADMPSFPMGYLAQLASPFRWGRVKAEAAAPAATAQAASP